MRTALVLLVFALARFAYAADGDICKEPGPGVSNADSWCYQRPPAANVTAGEKSPRIVTMKICDGKGSGGAGTGVTCGPVWIPEGGVPFNQMDIRPTIGISTAGCGFDNWKVYTLSAVNGVCNTGDTLHILAMIDDDGTATPSTPTSGTQFVELGGATGPCLYLVGDTTAGTCDATHTLTILGHFIYNPAFK